MTASLEHRKARPERRAAIALGSAFIAFAAALWLALPQTSQTVRHPDPLDGVALVEIRLDVANAFLLYRRSDAADAILIDAGLPERANDLAKAIKAAGVRLADLDAIIITHAHLDHAGGAKALARRSGAPIVIGAGDRSLLTSGAPDDLCPTSPLAHVVRQMATTAIDWGVEPHLVVSAPTPLRDMAGIDGQIIPLSGHTNGSLIVSVGDAAFVGDLVRGRMLGRGPARHFFMCDLADNDRDMASIPLLMPDVRRIFPGHFDWFPVEALNRFSQD